MSLKFPFEYAEIEGLGRLFYPIIHLQLYTVVGWREFQFLVDTGADVTTVPSHLLPVLGLKKNKLPVNSTLGVGGISVKSWEFHIPVMIGRKKIKIRASAVEAEADSIPLLLGKKDIFEKKYNLLIDSKNKVTVLKEN